MATPSRQLKQYLGEAVYADFDGYALILTTENGESVTNEIVLEPSVMTALLKYATTIWDRAKLAEQLLTESA